MKYTQPWRRRIKRAQRKAVRCCGPGGRQSMLGIGHPSALDTIFIASVECERAIRGYWREYYYKLGDSTYGRIIRGVIS